MQIDINELIELVKSVKPMFLNHTEAEHVTVKGDVYKRQVLILREICICLHRSWSWVFQ